MTYSLDKLGFSNLDVPGHRVVTVEVVQQGGAGWQRDTDRATCQCGFTVDYWETKAGRCSGYGLSAWRNHVADATAPDEIYFVGTIQKKRVLWELYVMPRHYSGTGAFKDIRYGWLSSGNSWGLGVRKSNGTANIVHVARTKAQALDQAERMLGTGERDGHVVTRGSACQVDAPAVPPQFTLTEFVGRVDAALASPKLAEVQEVSEALEAFMVSMPILESKRAQLQKHLRDVMTLGFDLSGKHELEVDSKEA
jgi:hypothetical protein